MDPISPEPAEPPDPTLCEVRAASASTTGKRRAVDVENDTRGGKKTISSMETVSASIQTTYSHPSMTILGIKSYESTDCGPYIVHVSIIEPSPSSNTTFRPIKFGQFLHKNKIDNICCDGVKKVGKNKMSVQFKTAEAANKFISNDIVSLHKMEAYIPTYNVTRMGLVRGVPLELSMEEFVKSLEIPNHACYVLKARRLNRKVKNEGSISWDPTQTVVLTFRGQELPSRIYSFYSSLIVESYQFPTIQCLSCCRFGHIKAQCRSKPRCYKCAQPHSGDECILEESQSTCIFCSGNHFTTSRLCPEQDRQKFIKVVMARDGISYQEASAQCPKVRRAYNEVAKDASPAKTHLITSSSTPTEKSPTTQSYRKTTYRTPSSPATIGKSYDRAAHQAIIANEQSSLPNGCALLQTQQSTTPSLNDPTQLLIQLLNIIVNMISNNSIALPSNVAQIVSQVSTLIQHGSVINSPMELQKSSSEDA